ncbi:MAG: DUF1918 domain-containing protein [Actinocrinis sp.]
MRASIGDKLHIHTNHLGTDDQYGRIVEIRGADGAPPYLVEFPDGRTCLVFPGPDAVVEPGSPALAAHTGQRVRANRRVHTRAGW